MRVLDRGILSGRSRRRPRALEDEFARVRRREALPAHALRDERAPRRARRGGRGRGRRGRRSRLQLRRDAACVALQGAAPVFVDVDHETGYIDPRSQRRRHAAHASAIMPVHMHGGAADMTRSSASRDVTTSRSSRTRRRRTARSTKGDPSAPSARPAASRSSRARTCAAGEGGLFVTNDDAVAEHASGAQLRARPRGHGRLAFDVTRPLDGHRALDSLGLGSMYRGNEMMAAFARAQLARLPDLTTRAQKNAERLARKLGELPGFTRRAPSRGGRPSTTSIRVRFDGKKAGLDVAPRVLRDAMKAALVAEGLEVVYWQSAPLPAQPIFQKRAEHVFRGLEGGTDLKKNYDPRAYGRTTALLESSIVLFSQSCPLIAQNEATVDRYAEAFARVWHHREAIVAQLTGA